MRIGVIGTGHVGLVTCVTLAEIGHDVVGIDSDLEKIERLRAGQSPFFEPGLQELLEKGIESGRLRFGPDVTELDAETDIVFVCVGTPARANGEADLSAVESAARAVASQATERMVVVEKSTVPAGTAERVRRALRHERPDLVESIEIVSNPEFLREGKAIQDSLEPDRILVGAESEWAFEQMRRVYAPLLANGIRLITTDIGTAELSKHACNAFLAMKISYANALARVCERSGADVRAVAEVMGADSRIGRAFLNAGLGYGGFCFPKDVQAFEHLSHKLGYEFPLLKEVARINEEAIEAVFDKVRDALWNLEGKRIALLGLAFKPGTDDIRFSPALALAQKLLDGGAVVVGYDPQASASAKSEIPELELASDAYDAAAGAHCVILCTEWPEFAELDLDRFNDSMSYRIIVDGRNLFDRNEMAALGFSYYPTGRPSVL
jgi:UDPglucose 6-dehydrogenase